jgi:ABC-type branched-subunit amino acid transport system substrate-binding protein
MRKVVVAVVCILAIVWVGVRFYPKSEAQDGKPVIRIGATLPLTGQAAESGQANQAAILMALDKWAQKDTKYRYEVIFQDDMVETRQGVLNAQNLISLQRVNAFLSQWAVGNAIFSALFDNTDAIHFACSTGAGAPRNEHTFNHYTTFEEQARVLIPQLQRKGVKRLAYFVVNTLGMVAQADYMTKVMQEAGIEVKTVRFNPGERDFRLMIAQMEQSNPDYYFITGFPSSTLIFLRQHREVTGKKNVTGIEAFFEMDVSTRSLVEGSWFVAPGFWTENFAQRFEEKTGLTPKSCTPNLYDAMDLLIWAFETTPPRAGEVIPRVDDVVETLRQVEDHTGAMGALYIDENRTVQTQAILMRIVDGKFVVVEE